MLDRVTHPRRRKPDSLVISSGIAGQIRSESTVRFSGIRMSDAPRGCRTTRSIGGRRYSAIWPTACSPSTTTPSRRNLGAPDALGAGHLSIGSTEAQPKQHLPILVHLEPPVGHRVGLPEKAGRLTRSKKFETGKRYVAGGFITPRFGWLHYAANPAAPLGRKSGGSITPRSKSLCGSELTRPKFACPGCG